VRPSKQDRDTSFAAFMDQAGPTLLRTAWFLTGNTDRAQELTQAALVKTYLAWPRIDHAGAHAYARKCLVNHKIDVWRATRHEVISDFTAPGPELGTASTGLPWQSGANEMATTDDRDELVRRLSRLPGQQRTVVVLRYYADQSEAAVAEALGISVGSVKSAASRGLAALRQHAEAQTTSRAPAQTGPMTTDLETDLRREFDAARPPSRLTFSPESIVSQGRRSIRRRRLMTSASTAVAVALVVVGSTLISRPHDSVMPPPATRTTTTGIVRDGIGFGYGTYGFDFDRDVSVAANVRLSFETPDGRRHELGSFSAGKPGQMPPGGRASSTGNPSPWGWSPELTRV
jgi:RNA polymerase sigma-70 factor (sigma-E family)